MLLRGPWIIESYYHLDDNADRFFRILAQRRCREHRRVRLPELTDRIKDVIKSGGEWISSINLENAIVGHPNVLEAAVIGVPHPKWQERPVALVVTKDGAEIPLAEIHELLDGKFAKWQLPDTILYLDALRTSVGKLDKVMRAQHGDVYAG